MSLFSPSHQQTPSSSHAAGSSPAYARPGSRLAQQGSPVGARSRTQTGQSSIASPSTSRKPNYSFSTPQHRGGGGSGSQAGTPQSVLLSRGRSYQQPLGTGGSVRRGEGTGRALKRSLGCDVVLDSSRAPHDSGLYEFVSRLGTAIEPPSVEDPRRRAKTPRPQTPAREPKLDIPAVRQNLRELYETERNYLAKMQAVTEHLARPLRQFASRPATAVISKEAAQLLFGNIEDLLPVSEQFEADLASLIIDLDEIQRADRNSPEMPLNLGPTILRNVERMTPFQTWLTNAGDSESTYRALERNTAFHNYLNRQIIVVRQQARSTGGLQELLAEPFQRISRYRLMLDPVIRHLPQDDPNIPYLQEAVEKLGELCSMETDEATKRTAEMWALFHTIDGLPQELIRYSGRQFLGTVDVDEVVEGSGQQETKLRCCLFLFSDLLIVAKRPSGEKGARQLAGLDNLDSLVKQFKLAQRNSAEASILAQGSPRKGGPGSDKIKKGVMGFRGSLDLLQLRAVDLAPSEFGLVLDHPPQDQNERWCGRSARRYVIAPTQTASDALTQMQEKRTWLAKVEEAQAHRRMALGAPGVRRSAPLAAAPGAGDDAAESVVYWTVWDRHSWEHARADAKAKLALHIVEGDEAQDSPELRLGYQGVPSVIARAVFSESEERCLFSVRSSHGGQPRPERIALERIAPAIAEIALSFALSTFPAPKGGPSTPGSLGRSRPRSFLGSSTLGSSLGGALDLLSASSLKRGDSKVSRASTATTTSRYTGFSNSISSASNAFSPRQMLSKKSAPELYGTASRGHRATKSVSALPETAAMEEEEQEEIDYGEVQSSTRQPEARYESVGRQPPTEARDAHRHRRSLSLPPKMHPSMLDSTSAGEEEDGEGEHVLPARPEAPSPARQEQSWLQDEVDDSVMVATSPIAYRPPPAQSAVGGPRRLMGPRAPAGNSSALSDHSSTYDSPFRRQEHHREPPATPPRSGRDELSASTGSKRAATSPRPSPAKKAVPSHDHSTNYSPASAQGASLPRGPAGGAVSPLAVGARRAPSVSARAASIQSRSRTATAEGDMPSRRGSVTSRRVVSGASTIRASSPSTIDEPATGAAHSTEEATVAEAPAECSLSNERLQAHIQSLRTQLASAREAEGKENARLVGALHRSPPTQNVSLKLQSAGASSFASAFASSRKTPYAGPDVEKLLRWTEELEALVEQSAHPVQGGLTPPPASPFAAAGPTQAELVAVQDERDALRTQVEALQAQVQHLAESDTSLREEVFTSQHQLAEQQALYTHALKMIDNVQLLWQELEGIDAEASQAAERGGAGAALSGLQARVAGEMKRRTEAEHMLDMMHVERVQERARMERYERLLRQNGLLE